MKIFANTPSTDDNTEFNWRVAMVNL